MQSVDGGPIKIGTTVRLSQRIAVLSKQTGQDLRVLAVTDGSFAEERAFHGRFSHLRCDGEWFEPGDDLLACIATECRQWDCDDEEPMRSLISLKGTDEFQEWVDQLVGHTYQGTRTHLAVNALREFAQKHGYEQAQPKR